MVGLFCCGPALNSAAQTRKIDSPEVLKRLLAMPAPTPRHAGTPAPAQVAETRSPQFYSRDQTPPDDAPIEDLIDYWLRWVDGDREPSEAVSKRLLEAFINDPKLLPPFLDLLPQDDSTKTKTRTYMTRHSLIRNLIKTGAINSENGWSSTQLTFSTSC